MVSEMTKGPLREVFDFQQLITDVSGSGNNWQVIDYSHVTATTSLTVIKWQSGVLIHVDTINELLTNNLYNYAAKAVLLATELLRCNCQTHSTILFSYIRDALHKFTYLFFVSPVYRAVGHKMYGTQYREKLSETIRRAAEFCDCLQCFFVLHSMGGGKERARVCFVHIK